MIYHSPSCTSLQREQPLLLLDTQRDQSLLLLPSSSAVCNAQPRLERNLQLGCAWQTAEEVGTWQVSVTQSCSSSAELSIISSK